MHTSSGRPMQSRQTLHKRTLTLTQCPYETKAFEPYAFAPFGEGNDSKDDRTMEHYTARMRPQCIPTTDLTGGVRLVGGTLLLPYDHLPHHDRSPQQFAGEVSVAPPPILNQDRAAQPFSQYSFLAP